MVPEAPVKTSIISTMGFETPVKGTETAMPPFTIIAVVVIVIIPAMMMFAAENYCKKHYITDYQAR